MVLRQKLDLLEKWEQASHYITLVLVAIASLAGVATQLFPPAQGAETQFEQALHAVHLSALGLAVLHVTLLLLFSHNTGKEIAAALDKKSLPAAPTTASGSGLEKSYSYRALSVSPADVEFVATATGPMAETLFTMNLQIFSPTSFGMEEDKIKTRNTALINKNPNLFMLVRNPLREVDDPQTAADLIGFTCVLPLSEVGADCYLNGVVRDRDMRASLVCKKGEACGTILVFAIGLKQEYKKTKSLRAEYYKFLLRCTEHHVNVIAAAHANSGETKVWAVSEHPMLWQQFKGRGFACNDNKKSADGFPLYSRLLVLPEASPQPRGQA